MDDLKYIINICDAINFNKKRLKTFYKKRLKYNDKNIKEYFEIKKDIKIYKKRLKTFYKNQNIKLKCFLSSSYKNSINKKFRAVFK
jgi:hypothetical protein